MNKRQWTIYDGWPDKKKKEYWKFQSLNLDMSEGLLLIIGAIVFLPVANQSFGKYLVAWVAYVVLILLLTRRERREKDRLFGM